MAAESGIQKPSLPFGRSMASNNAPAVMSRIELVAITSCGAMSSEPRAMTTMAGPKPVAALRMNAARAISGSRM